MQNHIDLHHVFVAMAEGLVIQNQDGQILDANPAAEHILGLSRDELLGRKSVDPRWQSIREDGGPYPGSEHPAMRTLRSGEPLRDQVMGVLDPRRGLRWLSINTAPIVSGDGRTVERVVATFVDITERKRAEASLAAARDELADLFDNAPCGYYALDSNGRFARANNTMLQWLGLPHAEVIGKLSPRDFMSSDDQDRFFRSLALLLEKGRVESVEYDLTGRHGEARRVRASATAVLDDSGRFVSSRSVMVDVTEARRVQLALRQMTLEQRLILDSELIGMVRLRNRRAVWKSRGLSRIFGYEPGELDGQSARMLYRDDESYEAIGRAAYPVLNNGGVFRRQIEMMRKDGRPVWIDMSGVLLSAERDDSLWLLADITPIKTAEAMRLQSVRLESDLKQLQQSQRAMNQFLSNVSHELRTPLNAIIGFAQLLESGSIAAQSSRYPSAIASIRSSGRHLLELIESLFNITAAELGQIEFQPQRVNLRELLQGVCDAVSAAQTAAGVEPNVIQLQCSEELTEVWVDPRLLRQVFYGLVSNAVKFSDREGSVEIRVFPEDLQQMCIEVQDHGIGIDEADLTSVFAPFEQLSAGPTKRYPGLGLGLALVKRLTEVMQGSLGVTSALGVGSTFVLKLPVRQPQETTLAR